MILIGADFVPTKSNKIFFSEGNAEYLLGEELCKMLQKADYRIFNLEIPLTDKETPINKCGPNLIADTNNVKLYEKIEVDLFTLANNHIMDQGEAGYFSTINVLDNAGIDYLGCGNTLSDACKPKIVEVKGKKIGIYSCAEHEFSIASANSAGANPFDVIKSYNHVYNLSNACDYTIVLYHGGKEHYRFPSPNLQKYCRNFIEKGANIVICQHSHCIGCEENYKNGKIIYGQGNFLFDDSDDECWKTGLLIQIKDNFEINYIPVVKSANRIRLADEYERTQILNQFDARSEMIKSEKFVYDNFSTFASKNIYNYLLWLTGVENNIVFRVINRIFRYKFSEFYIKKKYSKNQMLKIENMTCCESISELFVQGLKDINK